MLTSREVSVSTLGKIVILSDDKVKGLDLSIIDESGGSYTLNLTTLEVDDLKKAINMATNEQSHKLTRGDN